MSSLGHYLFRFDGRSGRAGQWASLLVALVHFAVLQIALRLTIGGAALSEIAAGKVSLDAVMARPQAHDFAVILYALYVVGSYISCAIWGKRLHDRGRSAWWVLLYFGLPNVLAGPGFAEIPKTVVHGAATLSALGHPIPPLVRSAPSSTIGNLVGTAISLWAFIDLLCLRGTVGENAYGPDPLASTSLD